MPFSRKSNQDLNLSEVLVFEHSKFSDTRGSLWSTYDDVLHNILEDIVGLRFNHDKFATNRKNVLRGIHGDYKSWKLVTVVAGEAMQVVVDCRPTSNTYLSYSTFRLHQNNPQSILIPPGFGNAFLCMTDFCVYHYKLAYTGNYNDAEKQFTFQWNDERIGIEWPIETPILSERDAS